MQISLLCTYPHSSSSILQTYKLNKWKKSIISARHRRLRGENPLWGTRWIPVFKSNNDPWRQYDPHASTHQPVDPNPAPPYSPPPYTNHYAPPPGPPLPPQQQQYEMQGGGVGSNNEQFFRQQQTGQHLGPNSPPPAHILGGRKDIV